MRGRCPFRSFPMGRMSRRPFRSGAEALWTVLRTDGGMPRLLRRRACRRGRDPEGARPDCPASPSPRPDGGDDEKNASNVCLTGSSASRTGISGFSPAKDVSVGQGRICGAVQIPDDALVPLKKNRYIYRRLPLRAYEKTNHCICLAMFHAG